MAPQIVKHAILMVLNNLANALKATVGPAVIAGIAVALLGGALGVGPATIAQMGALGAEGVPAVPENAGRLVLFVLIAGVILALAMSWAAVAWHRFILLEEYPGALPAFNESATLRYLGKSIVMSLLLVLIMVPVVLLLGGLLAPLTQTGGLLAGIVATVVLGIIPSYVWLRWALVLPAAAVTRPMGIRESWRATAPHSRTILGVAVLLMLLNLVLGLIAVPFGASIVAVILSYAVNWFTLMVGLSVLTTLYGHIVEGRELAE